MQKRVVRLVESDWAKYRSMRLSALQDAPNAFASRLEDQVHYDESHWRKRLANAHTSTDLPAFALVDEEPAGMAWAVIETGDTSVGHVFQMWVHPQHRGLGIGRLILDHFLVWFKSKGVTYVSLGVTCGNEPARKLYDSFGFVPHESPQPLREGSDLFEQEMRLVWR